jgi:ABC-type transport system involved in multi-copper enzyme maturation permease subunit
MTDNWISLITWGVLLALLQVLAALPWLGVLLSEVRTGKQSNSLSTLGYAAAATVGGGVLLAGTLSFFGTTPVQEKIGRFYGSILHMQLIFDLLIGVFALILLLWPRGGTVALAAFREGYRQPMFWLLTVATILLLLASMVIPYFTFGDDFKMMKQLGFDMIMLATVVFTVLAASISVSDEIEGRTAVTLMSKPVTRRQFLLGKYLGILLAGAAMTLFLGWFFNWALYVKPYFDRLEDAVDPLVSQSQALVVTPLQNLPAATEAKMFVRGAAAWAGETYANTLGLALGFGQVMVLLAVAASLATRLPMVVNLVICLVIFLLGHLAPVLVQVSEQLSRTQGGALGLVSFLAQLFDKLLPALEFFSTSQVVIRETTLELGPFAAYVGSVLVYAGIYSAIALLFGLILFEDRDLA